MSDSIGVKRGASVSPQRVAGMLRAMRENQIEPVAVEVRTDGSVLVFRERQAGSADEFETWERGRRK